MKIVAGPPDMRQICTGLYFLRMRYPYHPAAQDWLPTEAKQG